MAQSNRSAVEANNIPTDERLDLAIPRNGSLELQVTLTDEDDDGVQTPANIIGCEIIASCATSYQAKATCLTASVSNRDDDNAAFTLTFDATAARGLGVDVLDLVHDLVVAPTGGGRPKRYWAGLMVLSKGVGVPT